MEQSEVELKAAVRELLDRAPTVQQLIGNAWLYCDWLASLKALLNQV